MGLSDYLPKERRDKAMEEVAKVLTKELLYPAAEEYVKSTDNPYDDAALELVKSFLDGMIEGIHEEPSPEEPA